MFSSIICSFRNTLLEKLEPGFFNGMPELTGAILHGNKFSTLDASWFMPRGNALRTVMVYGKLFSEIEKKICKG